MGIIVRDAHLKESSATDVLLGRYKMEASFRDSSFDKIGKQTFFGKNIHLNLSDLWEDGIKYVTIFVSDHNIPKEEK